MNSLRDLGFNFGEDIDRLINGFKEDMERIDYYKNVVMEDLKEELVIRSRNIFYNSKDGDFFVGVNEVYKGIKIFYLIEIEKRISRISFRIKYINNYKRIDKERLFERTLRKILGRLDDTKWERMKRGVDMERKGIKGIYSFMKRKK